MAYQHKNSKGTTYHLHAREVQLRGSNLRRTIYFFAKSVKDGSIDNLPPGYQVVENTRTGLPVLKKANK